MGCEDGTVKIVLVGIPVIGEPVGATVGCGIVAFEFVGLLVPVMVEGLLVVVELGLVVGMFVGEMVMFG